MLHKKQISKNWNDKKYQIMWQYQDIIYISLIKKGFCIISSLCLLYIEGAISDLILSFTQCLSISVVIIVASSSAGLDVCKKISCFFNELDQTEIMDLDFSWSGFWFSPWLFQICLLHIVLELAHMASFD